MLSLLVLPGLVFGHSGKTVVSTVTRTVVPAPVVKKYEPEKASPTLTVLKLGVKDPAVALLQGFLKNEGYEVGVIDGHFGKATEKALKEFQKTSFGQLKADGVAGPATLKYIENFSQSNKTQLANNSNTVATTNTQTQVKVQIPSLPNKVLAQALVAPSLIPVSETNAVSETNKTTAKPKLLTKNGFANAGVFVTANNLNVTNTSANLNSNFSSGIAGQATGKYVCGTKDGVQSCFVVSLEEAAQIEAGTLDVDQVLLAKTGGNQSGTCPSFFVNENGTPGVTDQSWWNTEGCEQSNINVALSGENVCLDGKLYNQATGLATGATCTDGLVSQSKTNLDRGAETCMTGTKYNPLTGALCGQVAVNSIYIEQPPLICATGANYNPYTGVQCKPGLRVETDSFANTLAGYAVRNLKPVNKEETSANAQIVQRVLSNMGFLDPKYQTGFSGDITENAVKQFQQKVGVTADGKLSGQTLSYIKAALVSEPELKSLPKAKTTVSSTQSANKVLNVLSQYPDGLYSALSGTQVNTPVSVPLSGPTETQGFAALNPIDGGAGTASDIGSVYCRRITSTQVGPNMYTVRAYIGTDKLFWVDGGTPTLKYQIPGQTGPFPTLKILAGAGRSALYFTYSTKSADGIPFGAYPSLQHQQNGGITFEINGTDKIFTLSPDGKKKYSFDWNKLNDPSLPTCTMPSYGNGFIGIIGPDGKVKQVTGGSIAGNSNGGNGSSGPASQCADGVDNDNDGKVDYPTDPGCSSSADNTENSEGSGSGNGNNPPAQCADNIDNDGDGKKDFPSDPGCISATDNTENSDTVGGGNGGIQDGLNSTFDEAGTPCPTADPCHYWHCPSNASGQISNCQDWRPLRWAGPLPISFSVESNLTSPLFIQALEDVVADLNLLPNLHFTITSGNGNCNGYIDQKRIPVCQGNYGGGWLGVASMAPDFNNRLIRSGSVKLNTTHMSTDPNSALAKAWANTVICQEILHVTGILHNDTPFNVLKKTCMDYYTTPWDNQRPNGFDAEVLGIIYNASSQQSLPPSSSSFNSQMTQLLNSVDMKDRKTWGIPTESSDGKVITHYEKSITVGGKKYSLSQHFFPVPPQ